MKFFEIKKYLRDGGPFGKIEIKKPKVELLDLEKQAYTIEEAEEILGISLMEQPIPFTQSSILYRNIINKGITYKIWDNLVDIVRDGTIIPEIPYSDVGYEEYDKVLPRPNRVDPLIVYINNYIKREFKGVKIANRRRILERIYWAKRLLVINGRNPDCIRIEWLPLTKKEEREWLLMNLDYEQRTREEVVKDWVIGSCKRVDGKLIQRHSKKIFKPVGKAPYIRYNKLPLVGYEDN